MCWSHRYVILAGSPCVYSCYALQPLRSGVKSFGRMLARSLKFSFEYRVRFLRFPASRSFSADADDWALQTVQSIRVIRCCLIT
jgi:hypothetical protein